LRIDLCGTTLLGLLFERSTMNAMRKPPRHELPGISSVHKLIAAGGGDSNPGDSPANGVFGLEKGIVRLAGKKSQSYR